MVHKESLSYDKTDPISIYEYALPLIDHTLQKIRGLSEQNESRLLTTIRRMPQMKRIQLSESVFKSVKLSQNNTYYQFAFNICHLIHQSLLPNKVFRMSIRTRTMLSASARST